MPPPPPARQADRLTASINRLCAQAQAVAASGVCQADSESDSDTNSDQENNIQGKNAQGKSARGNIVQENAPFRFNDLPAEVRRMILKNLLPQGLRLALDPANVTRPSAFIDTNGDRDIMRYLLVSKAIYDELIPLLYRNNEFCITGFVKQRTTLTKIGTEALSNITHLVVLVRCGFEDLGPIWDVLLDRCPKLCKLTLVFYHDPEYWMKFLSDMALMPEPKPKVNLRLYPSIWAASETYAEIRGAMEEHLEEAAYRRIFFEYKRLPEKIRVVNVSVSSCHAATYGMLTAKYMGHRMFEISSDMKDSVFYSHLTLAKA